jgi:hypothetical protein
MPKRELYAPGRNLGATVGVSDEQMSALQSTNDQITAGLRRRRIEAAARHRAARPIRVIDGLLEELEELHLAGRKRVPDSFDAPLKALNASVPQPVRQELRSRITIAHLMDRLYDMQDALLQRKHGGAPDPVGADPGGDKDYAAAS